MKQINLRETEGRTVQAVTYDDYNGAILVFTDETYIVLQATEEYDSVYLRDEIMTSKELRREFGDATALRLGIVTAEQVQAEAEEEARKRHEADVQRDLRELQRIRAKYGL